MNDKSQVESILNDVKRIVDNVIIKLSYEAELYETVDSKRDADRYISASLERDNFNSYRTYPIDVLAKAGISNLNDLYTYNKDRHSIPREKRPAVLKAMRELVISEYVEMNDYYRELIGMPSIDTPESEWIYLTKEEMEYYEIDEERPIHEYPQEIQYKLERVIIPRLIEQYPEKTYLKHMGSKSVNLVRAREAKNFEIIFTDINLDAVFMKSFFETYNFAREYVVSVIYNKAFNERYALYNNFIGMHIMIMTIQRLIVDTIKMGIDRDFYDIVSIQKLFNVYGIPFFENLPLDYQRVIVKNVNMLIRTKSTDKVLYDIANTLFYERVKIFKYFLVRERKFDEDGEPIFLYKDEIIGDEPEKFYIANDEGTTFELAVRGDKLTTIESSVPYASKNIFMKDEVTGKAFRLFMIGDVIAAESVEEDGQVFENVVMYNNKNEKYILMFNDDQLQTVYTPFDTVRVYDYEKMYNVYFQAVDVLEKNVSSSLETKYNRYEYEDIIEDDVYWWETDELKQELYSRDYNYIDSKYISVTVMQNLTKMLYETSYYLNLLVDHKNTTTDMESRLFNSDAMKTGTDYLFLQLDRLTTTPTSIFDSIMILCALVSKKNGMKGNIIVKSPAQILSVLGFNFELNFDLIREKIVKYKRIFKNQEIVKYLDLLDIKTVQDIDTLYNNFRNFAEFCTDVIANTTDINEYKAYKELYKVLTVRKDMTNLFKLSNGEVASTYIEYLYDKLPTIAVKIEEMHKDETGIYIEHVIGRLNELVPKIEYLNTLNGTNNNIVQAISGLINFFKSYTVDLRNINIMYMFDNKMFNKIFMIDDPRLFNIIFPNENILLYSDEVTPIIRFDERRNLIIYDKSECFMKIYNKDKHNQQHVIDYIYQNMDVYDKLNLDYKDVAEIYKLIKTNNDIIDLRDSKFTYFEILHKDNFDLTFKMSVYNLLSIQDTIELDYKDILSFLKRIFINNSLPLKFKYEILERTLQNDKINFNYTNNIEIELDKLDKLELEYKDMVVDSVKSVMSGSTVNLNDSIKVTYEK